MKDYNHSENVLYDAIGIDESVVEEFRAKCIESLSSNDSKSALIEKVEKIVSADDRFRRVICAEFVRSLLRGM